VPHQVANIPIADMIIGAILPWIDITGKSLEVLLPPAPKCAYPLST